MGDTEPRIARRATERSARGLTLDEAIAPCDRRTFIGEYLNREMLRIEGAADRFAHLAIRCGQPAYVLESAHHYE